MEGNCKIVGGGVEHCRVCLGWVVVRKVEDEEEEEDQRRQAGTMLFPSFPLLFFGQHMYITKTWNIVNSWEIEQWWWWVL